MLRLLFLILSLVAATPSAAQVVRVDGAERDSATILLREIVDRGNYRVVDRDTVLGPEVFLPGDLLVVDARVALEGTVNGTVGVIRGDFFARPGSRVGGRILVFEGGAYPSARAETGEVVYLDPRVATDLEPHTSGYGLLLTQGLPGILRIPGLLGFQIPSYDRVDGLSLKWGGGLGFGGDTASIALLGTAAYRIARDELNGGVELRIRASQRGRISLSASRSTRTNDGWIRGELVNSASSFLGHSDVRNYYESDEIRASLLGLPPPPLVEGEGFVSLSGALRLSRDRSLEAASPWTLLDNGEPWRPNPPIDEGVIGSVTGAAIFGWRGPVTRLTGSSTVEWAPNGIGDFHFAQVEADADWWMLGPYMHEIEIGAHLIMPLGSGDVPRQRWSFVGGPATLPTFPTAVLRGDRLVHLSAAYIAGFPRIALPVVGPPTLRFEYAAGTAWQTGLDRPPLEQNVGVGIQLLFFTGMIYVDPTSSPALDPTFSFGAQLPLGGGTPLF